MKLNRRDVLKAASGLAGLRCAFAQTVDAPLQISSNSGLRVSVFAAGVYQLTASGYGWIFQGDLGASILNLRLTGGQDSMGAWQEIAFDHGSARTSSIRLYDGREIALFTTQYQKDSPNADAFPSFNAYPQGLFTFSYDGLWSYWFGGLDGHSPWLFFDEQANAVIFSPATNFMTAASWFGADGSLAGGIDGRIAVLPSRFTHRTVLAFGQGINTAFTSWGQALTGLSGKNCPANDANVLLNKLSYWTDAGAAHYYQPQDASQYEPQLLEVPQQFDRLSVPVSSMELDSWYYQKGTPPSWANVGQGQDSFQADPALFPLGLADFQKALGLPLITHARWIDAKSSLRNQYKISGNVAVDPLYWRDYARFMVASGVQVLEQDWLSGPAVTDFNLTDPDAFLDNMASQLQAAGRGVVYCMPLPAHLLQSSKYDNVFAARVSNDALRREHWDELLFDSRLASAVGLWPFADEVSSSSLRDLLISTLTAGPVGSGDAVNAVNNANLGLVVRPDGVIVKPDIPIVPTDATFIAAARSDVAPIVASTYTDHGRVRTAYVLAYDRTQGSLSSVSFTPASLGVAAPAYVFDFFQRTGQVVEAGGAFAGTVDYQGSYYLVAPIGPSGIAFLGDLGKFASCGKQRIEQLSDDGAVHVLVRFAPGEGEVALHFYCASRPRATATNGLILNPVEESPQCFRVSVPPAANGTVELDIHIGLSKALRRQR